MCLVFVLPALADRHIKITSLAVHLFIRLSYLHVLAFWVGDLRFHGTFFFNIIIDYAFFVVAHVL